ncbi:MAG: carbohydrate ABC transporter permease [Firmicutes bacterium]|nr:carbohydrate ABC transporter permease [Bacillota bacterium]
MQKALSKGSSKRSQKIRQSKFNWTYVWLAIFLILLAMPLFYAFIVSTLSFKSTASSPPKLLPEGEFLTNMATAWTHSHMKVLLKNSMIMTMGITIGKIVFSLFGAFALTHFGKFRGAGFFAIIIIISRMLPVHVRIIPTYELMNTFGWVDTYAALIFPFLASATGLLLLQQVFLSVPSEYCDSARIDGVGPMGYLFYILVPMTKATLSGLFLIEFVWAWNEYLWPLIITDSSRMRVLQIGIKMLIPADAQPPWNVIMSAVIIGLIPPLLIVIAFHDSLTKSVAFQSGK